VGQQSPENIYEGAESLLGLNFKVNTWHFAGTLVLKIGDGRHNVWHSTRRLKLDMIYVGSRRVEHLVLEFIFYSRLCKIFKCALSVRGLLTDQRTVTAEGRIVRRGQSHRREEYRRCDSTGVCDWTTGLEPVDVHQGALNLFDSGRNNHRSTIGEKKTLIKEDIIFDFHSFDCTRLFSLVHGQVWFPTNGGYLRIVEVFDGAPVPIDTFLKRLYEYSMIKQYIRPETWAGDIRV